MRRGRPAFATRLLVAQAMVLVAMSLTAWAVAAAVGQGIFRDQLARAGLDDTAAESEHVAEAFASSLIVALLAALLIAIVLALAVTWYFTRRVQASLGRVVASAAAVAAGDYRTRIPSPGLGLAFDEMADAVNELAERLDALEAGRRRMLSDLAHEMRTPLATLDAHLEAVQDGVRDLDDETLAVLSASSARLGRLARDIGAVARAEETAPEIRIEATPVRGLFEAASRAFGDRFRDKGVELRLDPAPDVFVLVDPARMDQVLGNLLDNALRHTPAGGSVTIRSRPVEHWVEIEVTDSGEGIPPEHLGRVFDRFYRADPGRSRAGGGSGIGLTITKALVEAQGGRITAEIGGPGQGARFVVRLRAATTAAG